MKRINYCYFLLVVLSGIVAGCKSDNDTPNVDWIDQEFAAVLESRGYIKNASTVTIKEVERLTSIDVSGVDYSDRGTIRSMKGLEYFVNLEELKCHSLLLTKLDVSSLKKLRVLECHENYLTSLDVSANKDLEYFTCYTNRIDNLDLGGLKQLKVLDCSSNSFTSLDVSDQEELSQLTCSGLNLTTLDVSNNTKLGDLRCHANKLKGVDISNCKSFGVLDCRWNPGENGIFKVTAWFDDINTASIWIVFEGNKGEDVKLEIVKK